MDSLTKFGFTSAESVSVELNNKSFVLDSSYLMDGSPQLTIAYESNDATHYTRVSFTAGSEMMGDVQPLTNPVTNFGSGVHILDEITPEVGYFMQTTEVINVYEGLYEYNGSEWVLKGKPVKNQEKVITDNGTYTPDAEYTGFDKVTVNVPKGIDTSDATATVENILTGKTAYVNGQKLTGTMVDNGAINITPSNVEQQIPAGYTSGGTVATDTDLLPENIKKGVSIFGVEGTLEAGGGGEAITDYITTTLTDVYTPFMRMTGLIHHLPELDCTGVTDFTFLFDGLTHLQEIPNLINFHPIIAKGLFHTCWGVRAFPKQLDFSQCTDLSEGFVASSISELKDITLPEVTTLNSCFHNVYPLITVSNFQAPKCVDWGLTFLGCGNLTNIDVLDTSNATNMKCMFGGKPWGEGGPEFVNELLSDESLNNILQMCINSKETNKTLAYIGLSQEQATKCATLSNWSAFTAAGWTSGY